MRTCWARTQIAKHLVRCVCAAVTICMVFKALHAWTDYAKSKRYVQIGYAFGIVPTFVLAWRILIGRCGGRGLEGGVASLA